MQEEAKCLVCNSSHWKDIEGYRYTKSDIESKFLKKKSALYLLNKLNQLLIKRKPRKGIVEAYKLNKYQLKRWKVIFEVWFPNANEVKLTSKYCNNCGFATYFPRPTDKDIANKYNYLKSLKKEQENSQKNNYHLFGSDEKRAKRLYDLCLPFLLEKELSSINVLDYGGGNGKLLTGFLAHESNCYVVDYNDIMIEGITKLGNDHQDTNTDKKFDLIICSHVLEHVSDLNKIMSFLKDHLIEDGVIYAEVPLQIWSGLALEHDPVTHINFFTMNSFKNLFSLMNFNVLSNKREFATYDQYQLEVTWLIASKHQGETKQLTKVDVDNFLFPSLYDSAVKIFTTTILPKFKF